MKVLIFALLVASASAQFWPYAAYPYAAGYPYVRYAGAPLASQYHTQDVLGQASYGYAYPGQAATNFRDAAGNQVGSYAYINPEGKEVRVSYVADSNGFRVLSNALPTAPVAGQAGPQPVQDTPEVVAAKAEFFKKFEEAGGKRQKRQILSVLPASQPVQDLFWQSVDSNKDGQPDVPVVRTLQYALPYSVAAPAAYSYVAAPAVKYVASPALAAPIVAPAPLVAKHTVKTLALEADKDAKTPADTTKLDVKEKDIEVLSPLASPYYSSVVAIGRKKRDVAVLGHTPALYRDLAYNSVDLNKDGQPDKAVAISSPVAYSTYGYSLGYPYAYGSRYLAAPYAGWW